MNEPRRRQISVRLEEGVAEIVERVAAEERRPVANLVRNVLHDWADSREHPAERVPA